MKKKLIAMLLAACSIVSMTGCGTTAPAASATASAAPAESTAAASATVAPSASASTEATPAAKKVVIGISLNSTDEFVTNLIALMKTEAEAKGASIVTTNAEGNVSKQVSDVDSLIAQKPDVIIIRPIDSAAAAPAAEAVKKAGIPVMVIDGAIKGFTSLTADQGTNGKLIGEYLNKWLAEKPERVANVGYIVGMYLEIAMPRMTEIFNTCTKAKKVIEAEGSWNADKGMKITEDWLQAHPEINVIAAMNDEMAIGAIQALKAAGKNMDDYLVFGVDGTSNGQKYIRSGELDATTYLDVNGEVVQFIDAALTLASGKTYDKPLDPNLIKLMTKDNIDQLVGAAK